MLRTIEIARHYISQAITYFGLRVVAEIARHNYEKGLKASQTFLDANPIVPDRFIPQLNYTAPWLAML